MVGLVLHDAGAHPLPDEVQRLPSAVERLHAHATWPHDLAAQAVTDRQPSNMAMVSPGGSSAVEPPTSGVTTGLIKTVSGISSASG